MSLPPRPVERVLEEQQQHTRGMKRALAGFFASLVIGIPVAFWVKHNVFLSTRPTLQLVVIMLFLFLPLAVSFLAMTRVPPPPPESSDSDEASVRRFADVHQSRARLVIFFSTLMLIFQIPILLGSVRSLPRGPAYDAIAAAPIVLCLFMALVIYLGHGFLNQSLRQTVNDEFVIQLKQRSVRMGYFLSLVVIAGFCIAARYDAAQVIHFLPLGLVASVTMPAFYFVFLDWKASRS